MMRKLILFLAAIVFFGTSLFPVAAQTKPFSLRQILNALWTISDAGKQKKRAVTDKIIKDVETRGVDFPLDRQHEDLLRDDDAPDALIEAIRRRSPRVPSKKTPAPIKPPRGVEIRKNPLGMELVFVPAGKFKIGSPPSEKASDNERPQKEITFAKGFWLGRFEVTQAQWRAVMGGASESCLKKRLRLYTGDNLPVVCVNWNDAKEFVARLNAKNDGFVYSLPSEAQWEYAARAGTTIRYYWGNDPGGRQICSYENTFDWDAQDIAIALTPSKCRDGFIKLAPVGSYQPNAFGLHDMLGNVSEWVEDNYSEGYSLLKSDGSPVTTGGAPDSKVVRGGSYLMEISSLHIARRSQPSVKQKSGDIGFRIAARLK